MPDEPVGLGLGLARPEVSRRHDAREQDQILWTLSMLTSSCSRECTSPDEIASVCCCSTRRKSMLAVARVVSVCEGLDPLRSFVREHFLSEYQPIEIIESSLV